MNAFAAIVLEAFATILQFLMHWMTLTALLVSGVVFGLYLVWYVRTPRLHYVDTERNRRYAFPPTSSPLRLRCHLKVVHRSG